MALLNLGKIMYELGIKKDGWKEGFESADKDLTTHEGKWQGFAGKMGGVVKGAVVGAVAAIGVAVGAMAVQGVKNMVELDDHMAKFRSSTGVTAEEAEKVRDTVKELYKVNEDSYEDIVKTAEALSNNMGMTADEIEKYAQNYMNYAKVTKQNNAEAVAAIDDLGDAWGLTYYEQNSAMDKLLVLNQEYGMGVQESQAALTKLAPAAKAVGISMDEATAYMAMFAQTGIDGATASTGFTKALQKVKSPEELKKLVKDIQDTEDPFKRAQKASELFGAKAGPQMAQALGESDVSIEAFIDSMAETEGAVTKASDAYDSSLKVQLNLLKKQLQGLFTDLGEQFAPLVQGFVAWLQENMPMIQEVLTAVFDAVGEVLNVVIGIIGDIIEVFKVFFEQTMTGGNEFSSFMQELGSSIGEILKGIGEIVGEVLAIVISFIKEHEAEIKAIVIPLMGILKTIISTTLNAIKDIIKLVLNLIKGDWSGAWGNIKDIVSGVWDGIMRVVDQYIDYIYGIIRGSFKILYDLGKGMFTWLWDGLKSVWEGITGWIGEKVSWLTDKLAFWKKGKSEMGGVDGSHFNGLSYVPFDGYLARLHEGERVLTKEENKDYMQGSSGGKGVNVTNNFYGKVESPYEVAKATKKSMRDLAFT